jgi:arylsulfatase
MSASVAGRDWPAPFNAPAYVLSCPQKLGVNEYEPHWGGRCNYAAELENIDKLMSEVQLYLEDTNQLNNTIVCIVGDHGEMLGDHNMYGKKLPWQASISVPLVCYGPGIEKGIEYNRPVTTLDLAGTFMDFAGTTANGDMTTQSLRPILTGGQTTRGYVSSGLDMWRVVVQQVDNVSYKLVCCKGPCDEPTASTTTTVQHKKWNTLLYDTQADRFDMHPIEDKPDVLEMLRQNLPSGWCPSADIPVKVHT